MAKRKQSFRNDSTDIAIVSIVAAAGGDMPRREVVRKLGQRVDLVAALQRLMRLGAIEVVAMPMAGRRPLSRVRLIGATAAAHGAGFMRIKSGK